MSGALLFLVISDQGSVISSQGGAFGCLFICDDAGGLNEIAVKYVLITDH